MALSGLLTAVWDTARELVASTAWEPVVKVARGSVLALLQQIDNGQLTVIESHGRVTICGSQSPAISANAPTAKLDVKQDVFWLRLALFADMVSHRRKHSRSSLSS